MTPNIISELILTAALAVISLLAFAARELVQVGIAYLKSKLGQTEFDRLKGYAGIVVKAVEQSPVYKDFAGDKKKELVKVAILQWAQANHLPVDEAMIDKFIEAAVQEMNSQVSSIDWVAGEILSAQPASSPFSESDI